MSKLVIVESPAKAKTINRYLGPEYVVLASFGHVRDLPSKNGSVKPEDDFAMIWEIDPKSSKQIAEITKALKKSSELILATDPDREGEAISWHIRAILEERKLLKDKIVKRVTFHEITQNAISQAMSSPREIDQPLVDAYLARRALDYLVGFNLSPVLWRKLPRSRSAGRVQSVALRLICDREIEIENFNPEEYWDLTAECEITGKPKFQARLAKLDGKKLEQFSFTDAASAQAAQKQVQDAKLIVAGTEKKTINRVPYPPFTTSTMQQEASRRLGMGAQVTMRVAQQLYEGVSVGGSPTGLITYMRTDGVNIAKEAVSSICEYIKDSLGADYLPASPRVYKTKAKNAQEAHEAIRPTNITLSPEKVQKYLTPEQFKLYDLIYRRALASQMASAQIDQTTLLITDKSDKIELRTSGSVIRFDGWLKIIPPRSNSDEDPILPDAQKGETVEAITVSPNQHFTQPPPRYSEASLVKKMEEIGIGRPSTYASIIGVLKDRLYVRVEQRRFIPEDRGRLVTAFLVSFFDHYVDTNFTADLEEQLDQISAGDLAWKKVMKDFWGAFSETVDKTQELTITNVIDALDEDLGNHFFPKTPENPNPRECPSCKTGRLGLKLGAHGAFAGCSNYPECKYTRPLTADAEQDGLEDGIKQLGTDNETGKEITLRKGPYGLYIQLGEASENKKDRPKRVSIPKGTDPSTVDLKLAESYLSLPRKLGLHPTAEKEISAALGPYGPYVKMGSIFATVKGDLNVLTINFEEACELINEKLKSIVTIGDHPNDGEPILGRKGRFGPYLQHKKTMARLPKGAKFEDISLEEAVGLIATAAEAAKTKTKKGKRTTTKAKSSTAKAKKAPAKAKTTKKQTKKA